MGDIEGEDFNKIIRKMIEKSLFTERQIEILLNYKGVRPARFSITRGAYYRQLGQARDKLAAFYYTAAVLQGLGILLPDDISVMTSLSERVSVIKDSDIFPEREEEVMSIIEQVIKQACKV